MTVDKCCEFYDRSYKDAGVRAQRNYPNEEFCRFIGRNWFDVPRDKRQHIKILELGCGSAANLWMLAKEGFDTYGIDISSEGLAISKQILDYWGVQAKLTRGDMSELPYPSGYFDAVCDVVSSHCLVPALFERCLKEVARVLKPGGVFFSYHISTGSDAYTNHAPAKLIDLYTLDGIKRVDSPFVGNNYPCRFLDPDSVSQLLENSGLKLIAMEICGRTYRCRKEYFEFVALEATNCKL